MSTTSTGKDVKDFRSRDENRQNEYRRILIPYLLLIGSQLPLCFVYLMGLWDERPHYRLFPAAFAGCAFFLFWRWPRFGEPVFFDSPKSNVLLYLGVSIALPATLFLSPWFSFAAFLCLFGSLLARTNDRQVFGTVLATLAPLMVVLQPPLAIDFDTVQGDIVLMSWLDSGATRLASDVLDLMQYPHNIAAYRMEFPIREFSAIHLGNSSLSVFTLLIITGLFISWQRMPMFRGFMLLVAACFWFMAFEALELIVCVVAESSFDNDYYSPGTAHRILQIIGLFGAGLMTLLSDRLIAFLFGPVDVQAIDENLSYQDLLCQFWNKAIAGVSSPVIDINVKKEVAWAKKRNSLPGNSTVKVIWAMAIVLAVMAIPQLTGLGSALSKSGNSILGDANVGPGEDSIAVPAAFQVVDYVFESATRESMFETNSHHWTLANQDGQEFHVVIHQPYSGWHDFDRDIRSRDWKPQSSQQSREFSVGETTLTVISMDYRNNLAEYRTAFNTQFDGFGEGFEVPLMWRSPAAFFGRASARIGNRTRPRLVTGLSMEINVYLDTIGSNPDADVQQAEALFESVATQVLTSIQDGSVGSVASDSEPK